MAKTVSFGGTDWDADQQAIDQRRKLAIALMQQSAQPTETAGGIAVRQSPLSGLARMLTGVVGKQDLDAADTQQHDLQSRKSAMLADWLERMPKATTEQQLQGDRPGAGSFENVTKQPGLNDYMQWASQGALMGPQAGQIGQTGLSLAMSQQQRADAEALKRWQIEESGKQRQWETSEKLTAAQERQREKIEADARHDRDMIESRENITRLAASLRPTPAGAAEKVTPGYRVKPDGSWEPIPGGPADQKAQATSAGKDTVVGVVKSLRDAYDKLDEKGGITNPDAGMLSNLSRGLGSSSAGQAVGKLVGTENQSLRNTIAQQRPLLLQAIMKATGMSAKQMDSNAELKLYLATATDPTLDVAANRRALDMIETLYGSPKANTGGATGGWMPDSSTIDAEMKRRGLK